MSKINSLKKPTLDDVRAFAEATPNRSGQIPAGDVRLTPNIRGDLHLKLKIRAAEQRTTVGELIEQWIEKDSGAIQLAMDELDAALVVIRQANTGMQAPAVEAAWDAAHKALGALGHKLRQ